MWTEAECSVTYKHVEHLENDYFHLFSIHFDLWAEISERLDHTSLKRLY